MIAAADSTSFLNPESPSTESVISPRKMARPGGLEPPACWFEASHSVQLSYGRMEWTRRCDMGLTGGPLTAEQRAACGTTTQYAAFKNGVGEGIRTPDPQDHNLML